jgi:hypothetical protein
MQKKKIITLTTPRITKTTVGVADEVADGDAATAAYIDRHTTIRHLLFEHRRGLEPTNDRGIGWERRGLCC